MEEPSIVPAPRGCTAALLKGLAAVTMIIDHIGAVFLEYGLYPAGRMTPALWDLDTVLRGIGRLAFPLYILLMAEGFFHTRSRGKYLGRLAAFAILSEIPFDLAFSSRPGRIVWLDLHHQNVFFTLAIGFAVIWGCEVCLEWAGHPARFRRPLEGEVHLTWRSLAAVCGCAALIAAGCFAAERLYTDYGGWGVAAMAAAWLIRRYTVQTAWEYAGMIPLLYLANPVELIAAAGALLAAFYRGARGRQGNKWLWYALYPAHLLLLAGLRAWML